MDIKSLSLKNILKDENGEEYFDLSVPSFDFSNVSVKDFHLVTRDEEGRIDMICKQYYGNTMYIDVLCLMNHIYNPFSIKENDMIVIPEVAANASQIYKKPEIPTWLEGEDAKSSKKSNKPKTNEKDQSRVNRIAAQKENRKPNELPDNKSAKKYINGKVILGTNMNIKNGK